MRYFQADIESGHKAQELAKQFGGEIKQAGGKVLLAYSCVWCFATMIVSLPDAANPDELLPPGVSFTEGHAVEVPVVEDQGIQE